MVKYLSFQTGQCNGKVRQIGCVRTEEHTAILLPWLLDVKIENNNKSATLDIISRNLLHFSEKTSND